MDSGTKRIGTFKEFLKSQRRLNEDVTVEVEWWDECKVQVLKLLEKECTGNLSFDRISDFCKKRDAIIGREYNEDVGNNVLLHIKELIFQLQWQSFYSNEMSSYNGENSAVHSMGLAVEQLAREIYDKIMEEKYPCDASDAPTTVLRDDPVQEPEDDYPDEICKDLPWEYESEKKVMKFKDYHNKINESVVIIDCDSKEDCIDYCLNRIEKEVGSFDPNDILLNALDVADDRVKARLTLLYVREIVRDYLSSEGINMIASDDVNADDVPADIVNQAMEKLYDQIADDVLYEICKINGVTDEEVE